MLRTRILTAIVMLPLVALLVYLGGLAWLAAVILVGGLAWREMTSILQRSHFAIDRILGLTFIAGAAVTAYVNSHQLLQVDLLRPLLTLLLIATLIWALYNKGEYPIADWSVNVAGALYLGFLLSHFVTLRERPNGLAWLVLTITLTWIADTLAYFTGIALGRHKLWPRISPKKTWEGLVGGSASVIIAAPLLGGWLVGLTVWQGLILGVLIAVISLYGDLAVSLFKRTAHVKDSSHLIPGHGGILDRLDSLLFTVPVAVYFASIIAGP